MSFGEKFFGFWGDRAAPGTAHGGSALADRTGPVQAFMFDGLTDPYLAQFMADGLNEAGERLSPRLVLRNAAVARCVFVISNAIAALPLQLLRDGAAGGLEKATDHPLYQVLAARPNHWQTAFVFRRLMQHRVLLHGNAYALVIRSRGAVRELVPLDPTWVTPKLGGDWTLTYTVQRPGGGRADYGPEDILHLMGPSDDGVRGLSLVEYAGEVLGLALRAQRAASRLFRQGVMAGGALSKENGALSPEAAARLRVQMDELYSGAENSGKWMVLEEGLKATAFGGTAKDSQNVETRQHQVEEVARIFGVPRPFLMVDDTSWGSGIEQLGIFFVQYGLAPHFVCWEQAIARTLLTPAEQGRLYAKFNERALLRGSMKDQADFFAKALGAGGSRPWMMQDEVRGLSDLATVGGHAGELGDAAGAPGGKDA